VIFDRRGALESAQEPMAARSLVGHLEARLIVLERLFCERVSPSALGRMSASLDMLCRFSRCAIPERDTSALMYCRVP
jgi:hypothetical protein